MKVETDHPVIEPIARRWSPYAYSGRPVPREDLLSILEAVRWAASSYNEQPWRIFIASKHDDSKLYDQMLSCLVDANQAWAKHAPVLGVSAVMTEFARNNKPNPVAVHDLGLATANMMLEAASRGLAVHAMAGIHPERAKELFKIPDNAVAKIGFTIGYPAGRDEDIPRELKDRDVSRRGRKPISETIFGKSWGQTSSLVAGE